MASTQSMLEQYTIFADTIRAQLDKGNVVLDATSNAVQTTIASYRALFNELGTALEQNKRVLEEAAAANIQRYPSITLESFGHRRTHFIIDLSSNVSCVDSCLVPNDTMTLAIVATPVQTILGVQICKRVALVPIFFGGQQLTFKAYLVDMRYQAPGSGIYIGVETMRMLDMMVVMKEGRVKFQGRSVALDMMRWSGSAPVALHAYH
ncbi:hypothetical protein MMC25_005144 [Agyrium rufum]|nr:hypothetical protein [Agyrium rufum]